MTLRYPEQKLDLEGPGYQFDAKLGTGRPGFKGRHLLIEDKCTGCQLCAIACDGIAVAIEMQKLKLDHPHNKKDIWPAVDYGRCVPPWTPVVTSEGVVPIEKIAVGDEVLTHSGHFKRVSQVFRRAHTGRIYTFKTLGNVEPLTVTEGHPILVQAEDGPRWVMPDQIKRRTYLTRPIIKETEARAEIRYEYESYHPAHRSSYFTIESVVLQFSPDLARLIGYYLSEGSADRYRVSFDINKKEETIAADIVACVDAVFGKDVSIKPDKRPQGLKLTVDSVRVATFFQTFGTSCDEKQLPPWVILLPENLQSELIKAAYLGDGHYSNKHYEYEYAMHSNYFVIRTTSRALAEQYAYILNRLGVVTSTCKNPQKEDRKLCYSVTVHSPYIERMSELTGIPAKNSPSYSHSYIKMTTDMILSPVVDILVEDVEDYPVMNLEVEDDNTFVASNQIVHNCVFCGLCVSPETPVMTNPGLKQINEISIGDLVLTHTGEYKPVTKVWDMQYSGPLYKIYVFGKPEPLVCTGDHPILAVSRPFSRKKDRRLLRTTEPLEFFKPGQLKKGDYLVSPIVKKEVSTKIYERVVFREGAAKRTLSLNASPDLFRLVGYYLAEGCCDGGRRVTFDFKETEKETFVRDCSSLVSGFFGKECVIRKNGAHGIRLVLHSAVAEDFFSQFGRGAANKKLPDWIFFAEGEKQLELLKGEWQGDGCRINQRRQKYLNITTTSKTLAYQLQSLYARLGIVATIDSEQPANRLQVYHVNVFGRWAIKLANLWDVQFDYAPSKSTSQFQINDRYVFMPIRRIEVEEVRSYRVMDVTVEEEHTFAPLGLVTSNCVDACPFDALVMTNEYELSAYDRESLKYTPEMLFLPAKPTGTFKAKIDPEKGNVTHG